MGFTPCQVHSLNNVNKTDSMLMRWKSLKACSKICAVTLCRSRGNIFSQKMIDSNFPFDSGWFDTFLARRFMGSMAKSQCSEKNGKNKISTFHKITSPSRIKLLMDFFDLSKSQAQRIIEKNRRLRESDIFNLSRNMLTLKESGLNSEEVQSYLQLLYFCPLTVEHQIAILQELRLINLKVSHYKNFKKLFKSPLQLVKDHGLLPAGYDPKWDILKPLQMPEKIIDEIKFPKSIMASSLDQIHQKLSESYLQWRLGCDKVDIRRIQNVYPSTKLKSMTLQQQVFDQLNKEWAINDTKIMRHGYLLSGSPHNLKLIKEKVTNIAGASIEEVVTLAPRVLIVPYHKLLEISRIFSDIGVDPGAVLSLPQICTLHPETIQERLFSLQQVPEFDALRTHPRILRLIYYNTKMKSRLDLLQQLKDVRTMPSLNILSGDSEKFHRFLTIGELKQNRQDVVTFLSKKFKIKSSRIRDTLKQQLYGPHTTVVNVKKNLHFLLEKGFSEEQVLRALEVVAYPPELMCDQLAYLQKRPETQPYSEFKKNPNALQLLLYFIEKNSSYRM